MKITQISFSKTVESQVMGAGIWTKISVTGEVGENENVANAIEEAKTEVETALQKYLPQQPDFLAAEKRQTFQDLKKELNATSK